MHGELFIPVAGEDSCGGHEECCIALNIQGTASTVTGPKYLASADGRQVLVDCSLFQGFNQLCQQLPLSQAVKFLPLT